MQSICCGRAGYRAALGRNERHSPRDSTATCYRLRASVSLTHPAPAHMMGKNPPTTPVLSTHAVAKALQPTAAALLTGSASTERQTH